MAFTEEDGLAVVMDDGIRDESVERRCRRRDGRLHLSDPAEDGLVGTVPERVGLSVLCERFVRLVGLRGGVVDCRESSSVLVHFAGCYHIERRWFVVGLEGSHQRSDRLKRAREVVAFSSKCAPGAYFCDLS